MWRRHLPGDFDAGGAGRKKGLPGRPGSPRTARKTRKDPLPLPVLPDARQGQEVIPLRLPQARPGENTPDRPGELLAGRCTPV